MDEHWNKYAQTESTTSVIMHRNETGSSGKGKVILGLARPFEDPCVKSMVGRARGNAESRQGRQGEKKTCLHGSYYRRVCRGDKVVICAVLGDMSLTASGGAGPQNLKH